MIGVRRFRVAEVAVPRSHQLRSASAGIIERIVDLVADRFDPAGA